jgi:S-adenosylmethionine:tRNA ribosyltransferase-isomerase
MDKYNLQNRTVILKKSDFYYELPQACIAQKPVEPRDSSRLMVYNRENESIEHKHFYDVCSYLKKGDVLVVNESRVIPARLIGRERLSEAKRGIPNKPQRFRAVRRYSKAY